MSIADLLPGESIEDLQYKGLRIISRAGVFTYGTDAVLLADFANIKKSGRVFDLGAGGGILSLLISKRSDAICVDAIEIDAEQVDRMQRSIRLNGLEKRIRVSQGDLREIARHAAAAAYDVVICNPPYHEKCADNQRDAAARTESGCTYQDVARAAAHLLRYRAKFISMCPVKRVFSMSFAMQSVGIEVKRVRCVRSYESKRPYLCMLEGRLKAAPGAVMEEPLTIYARHGVFTAAARAAYHTDTSEET